MLKFSISFLTSKYSNKTDAPVRKVDKVSQFLWSDNSVTKATFISL